MSEPSFLSFKLSDDFIAKYSDRKVEWGLKDAGGTSLSEITFLRTYSRLKEDGSKETWQDVCRRVIEGEYSIQKDFIQNQKMGWSGPKGAASAQESFERMFALKWTPPGRGLATMGSAQVNHAGHSTTLQNCAAVALGKLKKKDPGEPFAWMMNVAMLGVGIGYSTIGVETTEIRVGEPNWDESILYRIPDSREGWAESTRLLINSYLIPDQKAIYFDYSDIRPEGALIKSFMTAAPGPEPLKKFHAKLRKLFASRSGELIDSVLLSDMANLSGKCVVSGNVRRSALLAYGELEDKQFVNLKNSDWFPERTGEDGWAFMSNNSVKADTLSDLTPVIESIKINGEPGIIWEDVVKSRGRLVDAPDDKDARFASFNPCCLTGDTLINTTEGLRRIDSLAEPFIALVNEREYQASASWQSGIGDVYELTTGTGKVLRLTPEHRLLSAEGEWVEAQNFQSGDKLVLADGNYDTVESFVFIGREVVWDAEVSDVHCFEANGIIAHNSEQPLEDREMCTLADIYINNHDSLEDFQRTIKCAFLYAKTVTLLPTHFEDSNAVMQRNRRIGLSLSGITDFIDSRPNGLQTLRHWLEEGYKTVRYYDKVYSEWLGVRESNRVTTIKPGGTTSLVAGTSAGAHWTDGGEYYMRTLRLGHNDPLLPALRDSGHRIEPDVMNPDTTSVVYFPIKSRARRSARQVSLFEKAALAVELQRLWSDNGVSVTLTFDPETESDAITTVLNMYAGQLKAVSFLPALNGVYEQAPYSEITQNDYESAAFELFPALLDDLYANWTGSDIQLEAGCSTDVCDIKSEMA